MNIKIIDEKEHLKSHIFYGGQKQFQKHMEKLPVGKSMDFWWK